MREVHQTVPRQVFFEVYGEPMEQKNLEIKQNNLSVDEYEAKFTELSRIMPDFVNTKEKRARRFQQGLEQWIQNRVAVFELTDYAMLVHKASIVEAGSEHIQKERDVKNSKAESQRGTLASGNFSNEFNKGQGS